VNRPCWQELDALRVAPGAGGLTSPLFTNYTYDALGNLTSVVQGVQSRNYQYDGLSRLTQEVTPEAGKVTLSYLKTGGVLCSGSPSTPCTKTDARGIVTTYSYDAANRLTGKTHTPTTTGPESYQYGTSSGSYNIGRLLTMTDPSGSETYSYDQMGRITQLGKTIGSTTYTTKYTYNAGGQLTQLTYPSGRNAYYSYDNVGHLCVVDVSGDTSCTPSSTPYVTIPSASYDAADRPLNFLYGNGVLATAAYSPLRSQLSSLAYGKPVSTTSSSVTGVSGSCSYICHPVPVGCVTTCSPAQETFTVASSTGFNVGDSVTVYGNSTSALNGTWTVSSIPNSTEIILKLSGTKGYNGTGGILVDNSSVNASLSLLGLNYYYQQNSTNCPNGNAIGNNGQIQCINDVSSGIGDAGRSVAYTYDPLGRLLTAKTAGSTQYPAWGLSWTYDRYGNRSAQTVTAGSGYTSSLTINPVNNQITSPAFTYDTSGNVIAVPAPMSAGYTYDGEECNTGYTGSGSIATYTCDGNNLRVEKVVTGTNAVTTVSVRSGGQVIAEYDNGAAVTSPTREYLYASHLLAIVTGSTGGTGGTIVYQHRDHLSPRLFTDVNGNVTCQQGTYAFGESWYTCSASGGMVFTTYERDAESGNDYALARSYANSDGGRFLSPDPLEGTVGDPQSWNRYAYVENDPVNLSDPSGQNFLTWLLSGFVRLLSWGAANNPGGMQPSGCNMFACMPDPGVLSEDGEGDPAQGAQSQQPGTPTPVAPAPVGGGGPGANGTNPAATGASKASPGTRNQKPQYQYPQNEDEAEISNIVFNESASLHPNPAGGNDADANALADAREGIAEVAIRDRKSGHPGRVADDSLTDDSRKDIAAGNADAIQAHNDSLAAARIALAGANNTNGATQYRLRPPRNNPEHPINGSQTTFRYGPFQNTFGPPRTIVFAP